jgi:hypothetical protein
MAIVCVNRLLLSFIGREPLTARAEKLDHMHPHALILAAIGAFSSPADN